MQVNKCIDIICILDLKYYIILRKNISFLGLNVMINYQKNNVLLFVKNTGTWEMTNNRNYCSVH